MSNTNRDYLVICDVKNSKITISRPINFYVTDQNTSNIFVRLVTQITTDDNIKQYVDIENSTDYTLTLRVIKPNNETKSIIASELIDGAIYQIDLAEDYKDMAGSYKCELLISTTVSGRQELNTSDPFIYTVKRSIYADIGNVVDPEDTTTETILNRLDALEAGGGTTISSASDINITDTNDYFTSTNVEGALQEAGSQIKDIMNNGIGITFEYITEEVEEEIPCTDITLNVTTLTFTSSGTQTIIATLTPSDTTDTLTYSSNNKNVATVTNNGVVTAIGNGDCTITIACGNITKTISVSVSGITETVAVTGITVSPTTATINVNDTVTLTATIEPSNASNQNVTWSSDNTTVAQVIDGVVTGIAQGTASIGAATEDGGYSATCNVTVNAKISTYANLFDKDTMVTTETKGITGSGVIGAYDWGLATVPVQANTQYSLKMCETNASGEVGHYNGANAGAIGFADSTGTTLLSYLSLGNPSNTTAGVNADLQEYAHGQITGYAANETGVEWITFTTPSDCCYLLFNTKLKNNADKIQLEQGDTIHDYYLAYNGGGN